MSNAQTVLLATAGLILLLAGAFQAQLAYKKRRYTTALSSIFFAWVGGTALATTALLQVDELTTAAAGIVAVVIGLVASIGATHAFSGLVEPVKAKVQAVLEGSHGSFVVATPVMPYRLWIRGSITFGINCWTEHEPPIEGDMVNLHQLYFHGSRRRGGWRAYNAMHSRRFRREETRQA